MSDSGPRVLLETPWITVVAEPQADGQPYYVIDLSDYVAVVATTPDGQVLLVRQHRPVVDRVTLELPSGHVDAGELPEDAARRELFEETGYRARRMELLGTLVPDVGRLRNRLWCFYAPDAVPASESTALEPGVTLVTMPAADALRRATDGTIDHALALAAFFLAVANGRLALAP